MPHHRLSRRTTLIWSSPVSGRAATVRPGKPSYRTAFQALSGDKIFAAQNELAINSQAIAGAQATIKSSQEEVRRFMHECTSWASAEC